MPHSVVRDPSLADRLHREGLATVPFAGPDQLFALRELFDGTHAIPVEGGGLFYSLYSRDYGYRERVDREMRTILAPSFERWFRDFDNVVNMFVVKMPGPASEFEIHQDTTALDERVHSPLSVWLPLREIGPDDGGLAVVRRSHHFLPPWRGVSFAPAYARVLDEARRYLEPVPVALGDAVLLDGRILHGSLENRSGQVRPVVVSGIFPAGSELLTCYREPAPGAPVELVRQPRDFVLRFPNFLHDCHARPVTGETVETLPEPPALLTPEGFDAACRASGLEPLDAVPPRAPLPCHMIGEPR